MLFLLLKISGFSFDRLREESIRVPLQGTQSLPQLDGVGDLRFRSLAIPGQSQSRCDNGKAWQLDLPEPGEDAVGQLIIEVAPPLPSLRRSQTWEKAGTSWR